MVNDTNEKLQEPVSEQTFKALIEEFNSLRGEIIMHHSKRNDILLYTSVIMLTTIGYAFTSNTFILLAVMPVVIFPLLLMMLAMRRKTIRISKWIEINIESRIPDLNWESTKIESTKMPIIFIISFWGVVLVFSSISMAFSLVYFAIETNPPSYSYWFIPCNCILTTIIIWGLFFNYKSGKHAI